MGRCVIKCPPSLPAGERRIPITVQRPRVTDDGEGGERVVWDDYRSPVWCSLNMLGGGEPMRREALQEEATHQFLCLYADGQDVLVTDRLFYRGIPYNIRSVDNLEMLDRVISFKAERGVPQ